MTPKAQEIKDWHAKCIELLPRQRMDSWMKKVYDDAGYEQMAKSELEYEAMMSDVKPLSVVGGGAKRNPRHDDPFVDEGWATPAGGSYVATGL